MAIENLAPPQTDAQGNPLPPQGAAPGATPPVPGILAGAPDLASAVASAFMKHLTVNQPPPVSAVVAKQKAAAEEAKPVEERAQPAPGSFGDKLSRANDNLGSALSDASHATDRPGGWLSGVTNTLAARQQRIAQEQKDAVLMAKSQAETVAMHRNFYQQDQAHRTDFYNGNQKFVDKYKASHDTEDGVTQSELTSRMQKDAKFPSKYFVRATGESPVFNADGTEQKDKNGNPVTIPTYTVVTQATKDGSPDDKTIDANEAGEYSKYLGLKYPEGTKLTSAQYNALDVQAKSARNAATILQNTNGKELNSDQMAAVRPYLTDPTIQHAIAAKPGNVYAGIQEGLQNADEHISHAMMEAQAAKGDKDQQWYDEAQAKVSQFREEREKLLTFSNMAVSPKQIEDYNKKSDDAADMLKDMQKKADGAHGEEAAAMAASTQKMIEDGTYTAPQLKILGRIHEQVQAAAKASQQYKLDEEKNKAEITNALAEDDVDVLVNAATNYQLNPNKMYSMRKNTNANFKAEMLRREPTWSEAIYEQRYNMQKSLASDKTTDMGGQVDSLNRFALHTGTANRSIQGLRNLNSPIINTPLNKIKESMTGFAEAQAFKIEMETAKDEFLTFIKNGHVPPTAQEERLAASVNENKTPAELQAVFRSMAELVAARAKSMNGRYATIMGSTPEKPKNIPGLLQPDTDSILRQFGVDVDAITNTTGTTSFSRPINPAQKTAQQPKMGVNRPQDVQTATGAAPDPKTGKMYWHDASGKVLREVKSGELPNE